MMFSQRHGRRRRQRNALVGRAEQNVEADTALDDRRCVETPQLSQRGTGVEQPGIEEVRAGAPGLEGELTKAQNASINGKTNEIALIRLHEKSLEYHGFS